MKTYAPRPSARDLRRVRLMMSRIVSHRAGDLQTAQLLGFSRRIDPAFALTIDFDAVKELGFPLVVMRPVARPLRAQALLAALSPRERQVARLITLGLRNREVSQQLGISSGTVKDHVHHILQKSECASRCAFIAATATTR